MKTKSFYLFIFICLLGATTGDRADSSAASPAPSANPAVGKDVCLGCHGPFNDLAAAATTFSAENGDKVKPHRYVPHNRTDDKAVVECTKCHRPHEVPLPSKPGVPKANAEWCYSCHHTHEFFPCKNCHP